MQTKEDESMSNITTLGIDLAKNVFHLHGVDRHGNVVLQKRVSRRVLPSLMAKLAPCRVGIEACTGAHYWSRVLRTYGHEVGMMNAQFVKPYVKSNKNDCNDAEAICEAVSRPNMRFVTPKNVEQQDIQSLHRIRQRLVQQRTTLVNQLRGLLSEYGVVLPQGISHIRGRVPGVLEDGDNELSGFGRELFNDLYEEFVALNYRITGYERRIQRVFEQSEVCQRLAGVEGIGPITATALVAAVGDARAFRSGREMAAWLGLVPRQCSTGGKPRILGISKRGDRYLRTLLIHGARAAMRYADRKTDARSQWVSRLKARRGKNITSVALANKNARICWALMARGDAYAPQGTYQ